MQNRNLIMRIVVLALMMYALASFVAVRAQLRETRLAAEQLAAECESLQAQSEQLEQMLETPRTDEEMQALARDRLGMVMPGDKIFEFITDREEP